MADSGGELFDGVTLACFGRDPGRPYGGAVLRVDGGASYAFGGGRAGALVCILLTDHGEVGEVYCIAGSRRPELQKKNKKRSEDITKRKGAEPA